MFIRFLRCDVIDEDGEVQRTVCFSDRSTSCKCSMVIFVKKTVDPTTSTNFIHLFVSHATVAQTECEAKTISERSHKSNRSYMCIKFLTCEIVNLSSLS